VEYVYLVASLPSLELTTSPRFGSDALLASSQGVLRPDHWDDLRAIVEDRPGAVRSPEVSAYLDADSLLRNELARRRADRAGAAYDPAGHPHRGFDPRCVDVAARAMELEDPLERELTLDRFRWLLLDELALAAPFGVQAVFAYAFKSRLAEKWAATDEAEGLRIAADLTASGLAGALP